MRKIIVVFVSLWLFLPTGWCQTKINIEFDAVSADSLFIKGLNDENKMETFVAAPFATSFSFEITSSMSPGMYLIMADSNFLDAFLISERTMPSFSISFKDGRSRYSKSLENERYHDYLDSLQGFEEQIQLLNREYQEAQQSMPSYMLSVLVDTLNKKASLIGQQKRKYQQQVMQENRGTLFASVVAVMVDVQQPPQEIARNRELLQRYYCQHFLDNFPWQDERIYRTPMGGEKIKEYCQFIAQCNRPEFDQQILSYLDSAKKNAPAYFALFDQIEKILGDHASPIRIERLYIAMLQDMLNYPKITSLRQRHCQYELGVINKNNVGDKIPNFTMMLSQGETVSLYDIEAEYLLLYLQHPTCPTCQRVRKMIADFPILNKAIASQKLKVLTVYFEDEQEVWTNYIHSPEANPNYLHGWNVDQIIQDKNLFDTRAIPYMFILDKDKRVVVKNVSEYKLEDEIKKLNILN